MWRRCVRGKYHRHNSHTRPKQKLRSRRRVHRQKNRETNCRGTGHHSTLRRAAPHSPTRSRRAEDAGKRAASRCSTLSAAWSRMNILTFAARVPSSSARRIPKPRAIRAASTRTASSLIALSVSCAHWRHKAVFLILPLVLSLLTAGHRRIKPFQHSLSHQFLGFSLDARRVGPTANRSASIDFWYMRCCSCSTLSCSRSANRPASIRSWSLRCRSCSAAHRSASRRCVCLFVLFCFVSFRFVLFVVLNAG